MRSFISYSVAAYLAVLLLPTQSQAQIGFDTSNQDLTLRFFPEIQKDTCGYSNTSEALTFRASGIPALSKCFNFADIFGGNATSGLVNQTDNLAWPSNSGGQQAGIAWQLENKDRFDPQANYSRILYHQSADMPGDDRFEPGAYAYRRVNLYGGINCTDVDLTETTGYINWYGFNCWSDVEGNCGTLPYSIASFTVMPGPFEEEDGTCMVFAEMGVGSSRQPLKAAIGALVGALVTMWLTS